MPDSPAALALTREQRRRLLAALDVIPTLDNPAGRDLRRLNALDLSRGRMSGRILQTLYDMLTVQPAPMLAESLPLLKEMPS